MLGRPSCPTVERSACSRSCSSFVLLTIAGITVLTAVGYVTARQSLTASAERQLLGLQRSKTGIVKSMLTSMRNEALAFSATDVVTQAAVALRAAHRDLERVAVTPTMKEDVTRFHLQEDGPAVAKNLSLTPAEGSSLPTSPAERYLHYHYVVQAPKPYGVSRPLASATDTSRYGAAAADAHAKLGPFMKRLGFENILLVDPETLEVFYSHEESTVLGTNLASGPYAQSNFAAMARTLSKSKDVDDYLVGDFEAYRPRLGAPGAFIGTPVFDGPRMVAVLLLRFRLEPIRTRSPAGSSGRPKASARPARSIWSGPI